MSSRGDVALSALRAQLPEPLQSAPDLRLVIDYLRSLDGQVARYPHYLEWNLGSGAVDLDFAFPTTIDGFLRLAIEDLCGDVTRDLARHQPLDALLARLRAMPLDDPLFPMGVTLAIDRLTETETPALGFAFTDYRPELGPLPPEAWVRVFELVGGAAGADLDAIQRHVSPFQLGHVAVGWRAGRRRHKAYVLGPLRALVDTARAGDGGALLEAHRRELDQLVARVGARRTHMVIDVEDGRAIRFGFELNFSSTGDPEYAALVGDTTLWTGHVPDGLRDAVAQLAAPLAATAADGSRAEAALCHLKVSFDGAQGPEWKAYLVLVSG